MLSYLLRAFVPFPDAVAMWVLFGNLVVYKECWRYLVHAFLVQRYGASVPKILLV